MYNKLKELKGTLSTKQYYLLITMVNDDIQVNSSFGHIYTEEKILQVIETSENIVRRIV